MSYRALLPIVASIVLAACAQAPEVPDTAAPATAPQAPRAAADSAQARAIAKHQRLAARARESGDIAMVATELQLLALLDPDNAAFRRDLAQARASVARALDTELEAGRAAERRGDSDAAAQAMVRVLVLDPDNAEATEGAARHRPQPHVARAGRARRARCAQRNARAR